MPQGSFSRQLLGASVSPSGRASSEAFDSPMYTIRGSDHLPILRECVAHRVRCVAPHACGIVDMTNDAGLFALGQCAPTPARRRRWSAATTATTAALAGQKQWIVAEHVADRLDRFANGTCSVGDVRPARRMVDSWSTVASPPRVGSRMKRKPENPSSALVNGSTLAASDCRSPRSPNCSRASITAIP